MRFNQFLKAYPVILMEGSIIERISRENPDLIDPIIANASCLYSREGTAMLKRVYDSYLSVGAMTNLPMIMLTPTWRASMKRVKESGIGDWQDMNIDAVRMMNSIRDTYPGYNHRVLVGGLMGCVGDAYNPDEAMPTDDARKYHLYQAQILSQEGVDFLLASTMPAATEALGMAMAFKRVPTPGIIGFVLRKDGTLLDGVSLVDAINQIDQIAKPYAYMLSCTHPHVAIEAMNTIKSTIDEETFIRINSRIIGIQANASDLAPEELDKSEELVSQKPADFAMSMADVFREFGWKILGGCCGTDDSHVEAIARLIKAQA